MKGTLKWFNHHRGYGFIIGDDSDGRDIWFHTTQVQPGLDLSDGAPQTYELEQCADGKVRAIKVRPPALTKDIILGTSSK